MCCNPPLDQNLVFFFYFLKENIDVEQKTGNQKKKTKITKRDLKQKRRQQRTNTERIDENQTFKFNIFEVVFFA